MSYIGTPPKDVRSFGKAQFDFTATQGQTVFTGADDDSKTLGFTEGQIQVHVNGVLLDGSDYSTSNNNTVTLSAAANANDVLTVLALQTDIPNSDYVPISGGTFSGDVTFGDNDKAIFGAGSDLQIYHDGQNSFIDEVGAGNLVVKAGSATYLQNASGVNMGVFGVGNAATLYNSGSAKLATTSTGIDVTGTITSDGLTVDGDLLVGTTSFNTGVAGGGITNYGFNYGTVDGGLAARFTRLTSDGDIVQFRKDGSTVGSISVSDGDRLNINSGSMGLKLFDDNKVVLPTNGGGTNADAQVTLGGSTVRFKDLYLSGGVYLGGTGSANKLADYEEGTWTAHWGNGNTSISNTARYIKIGTQVTFWVDFYNQNISGISGNLRLYGLPFAQSASGAAQGSIAVSSNNYDFCFAELGANTSTVYLYRDGNGGADFAPLRNTDWNSSGSSATLRGQFSYRTDS